MFGRTNKRERCEHGYRHSVEQPDLLSHPVRRCLHVHHETGEAKIWLALEIAIAQNYGLSAARLAAALRLVQEHEDEIRRAWQTHFGS
jgi:hypothetical protein